MGAPGAWHKGASRTRTPAHRNLGHGRGAAIPRDNRCARCWYGEETAACTCIVEDRCSNKTDSGVQCMKGAGHRPGSKCVTAAGRFFE
jgi:hypothetical protein